MDYLLARENLEFLMEDNEFLNSAFSCSGKSRAALGKRTFNSLQLVPSTPLALCKKQCKSEQ